MATSPVIWPANLTSQQLAAEKAQELANRLGASVNAGLLAQGWLDRQDQWRKAAPHHRRHRRRHRHRGTGAQAAPPAPVPAQQNAARQYLLTLGVPAAIAAVLASVLAAVWAAAATAGWMAAVTVLGLGFLDGRDKAIERILAAGEQRLGWVLETRLRRLEAVLAAAARDGTSADTLAEQVSAILGSLVSALLVTGTETTWAQQQAALRAYRNAGVKWTRWVTMHDGRVCPRCKANQAQGPVRLGRPFSSGNVTPPAHPRCRCHLVPSGPPKRKGSP